MVVDHENEVVEPLAPTLDEFVDWLPRKELDVDARIQLAVDVRRLAGGEVGGASFWQWLAV